MSVVNAQVESELFRIFGEDRVRTDRIERKLYSYDVGAMPGYVKPFIPVGLAGAVVRPENEEEIVELVNLANSKGLKLVPRGSATSGYGGALPVKGAIVLDMTAMNKLLETNNGQKTVRVQPGIIWEQLQKQINKQGLDLRLYPSSTPSSTVGGWLSQGGSGFGSFEYGLFKDNVLSCKVVLPTGEIRKFEGQELSDLIADAEGITGIVTEVTIALRDFEAEVHRAVAFKNARALGNTILTIEQQKLPIWSITYLNPESLSLKGKLPHKHGHPYEEAHQHYEPELPVAYVAMIAYPESRREAVDTALAEIIRANGGEELSKEAAEHEWELRFSPMRLKRIGPSIIPTEAIVPLAKMADALADIDAKVKQPFILEGMVAKGGGRYFTRLYTPR